jgi:hypothetical protein
MEAARVRIETLLESYPNNAPSSMEQIMGEWELVLTVSSVLSFSHGHGVSGYDCTQAPWLHYHLTQSIRL